MSIHHRSVTALLALATAGTLLTAAPAVAASASPSTPASSATATTTPAPEHEVDASAVIARRIASLQAWQTRVDADTTLTAAHRSALDALLTQDLTALQALAATVGPSSDPAAQRDAASAARTSYRVYALVAAQVRDVSAGDRQAATATALSTLAARVDARSGSLSDADQAALADLTTQIGVLRATAAAVAPVLALQPSDVPDPADRPSSLTDAAAAVTAGRAAAKAARTDLKSLRADLRTPRGGQRRQATTS